MPQPTRARLTVPHVLGLFVFVVTAAVFASMFIARLFAGLGSLEAIASAFSLLVAIVACFAMLVDAVDAWVNGRSMTPHGRRMTRSLVTVALVGSLAAAVLARQIPSMIVLGPALVIYLFIARESLSPKRGRGSRPPLAGPGAPTAAGKSVQRSRQRPGGKKHR
ncbi:MAG: hypothetical protein WCN81_01645 [Actinomycetes bacterium]